MHFKRYILLYTLIPLLILTISATYYRFMVIHDYTVSYEIECDPVSESCFIGCEDEECSKEYFYAKIERSAPDLVKLCGDTILDCEFANVCTIGESGCFVTFCDSSSDYDSCDNYEQEKTSL